MIKLSLNVGEVIRKSIRENQVKNNIEELPLVKKLYNKQDTFLEEELYLVSTLTMNREILDIIDKFPNVEVLTIDRTEEFTTQEITYILQSFPKLKKLTIKDQDNLQVINLTNLSSLEELSVTSNRKLFKINGLDNLDKLKKITFYNNPLYSDLAISNLVKYIRNNKDKSYNIDTLYFKDLCLDLPKDIKWSEFLKEDGNCEVLTYDTKEMLEVYKVALDIIKRYIKSSDSDEEKFSIIYQFLCQNINYNFRANSLDNGVVKTLLSKEGVCQGYTKSLQFLLSLVGIKSLDVSCIMDNDFKNKRGYSLDGKKLPSYADHSIIKVSLNKNVYYSDVTSDSNRVHLGLDRKYFLLSKGEIEKTHKLVGEEESLSYNSFPYDRKKELEEMARLRVNNKNHEKGESIWYH